MSATVNIIFENNTQIFYPGQSYAGFVRLSVSKPISCNAIFIKQNGFAEVQFEGDGFEVHSSHGPKEKNINVVPEPINYSSIENYYTFEYKLWGDGINSKKLFNGTHQFPFSFVLPFQIPSSFESEYGFVRHFCEARMKITSPKYRDISCSVPLFVVSEYDLNKDPIASHPISKSASKDLYLLWYKSGPVSFTLNIDRSGYVPGESIVINAHCSNKSNRTMKKSKAEIVQVITYKAEGKVKSERKVICFKEHPELPAGGDNVWESEPLLVPSLPPSHLPCCNIIDIEYMFVFKFIPTGLSFSLESNSEIVIGTIPLQNILNSPMHHASYHAPLIQGTTGPQFSGVNDVGLPPPYQATNDMPSAPVLEGYGSSLYPDLPPSYEDSIHQPKVASLEDFQYDDSDDE